jgi:hypothetical protein
VIWWYLSFAGPEGFRGGCFVEGRDLREATMAAHHHGINPGGEVMGFGLVDGDPPPSGIATYKLLSLVDLGMAPGGVRVGTPAELEDWFNKPSR